MVSGLLTALAAAFRLDIALCGLAAGAVLIAARDGPRRTVSHVGAGLALGAAVYAVAIMIGPGPLYDALIGNSLRSHAYWTLPFPLRFHQPPGPALR